jgi:hypothetical protein
MLENGEIYICVVRTNSLESYDSALSDGGTHKNRPVCSTPLSANGGMFLGFGEVFVATPGANDLLFGLTWYFFGDSLVHMGTDGDLRFFSVVWEVCR